MALPRTSPVSTPSSATRHMMWSDRVGCCEHWTWRGEEVLMWRTTKREMWRMYCGAFSPNHHPYADDSRSRPMTADEIVEFKRSKVV